MIRRLKLPLLALLAAALAACGSIKGKDEQLLDAVRAGSVTKTKALIAAGAPVNLPRAGWSPLMEAIMQDNPELVAMLIAAGADINARSTDIATPAHLAARWGKYAALEKLLEHEPNLEPRDNIGWTPLMWASLRGKERAIAMLLEKGVNANALDSDGNTPAMLAASRGHAGSVRLLAPRTDLKIKNRFGKDAAGVAEERGFKDLAAELKHLKPALARKK